MPDVVPPPLPPPAPPRRRKAITLVLLGLTSLGLVLRVAGLAHGLPDLLHPDVQKQLVQIPRFLDGQWIPTHRYPVLHIYAAALGLKGLLFLVPHPISLTEAAVAVRLLNAFAMTAVIPLVFLIGARLVDARVGLWAAALAALSSLHGRPRALRDGRPPSRGGIHASLLRCNTASELTSLTMARPSVSRPMQMALLTPPVCRTDPTGKPGAREA
jgi:hypothetical protein